MIYSASQMALHQMTSAINFRPLNGFTSTDGRMMKSNLIFRSGSLSGLDRSDARHLKEALGISTYIDLRTPKEIANSGRPELLIESGVHWRNIPISMKNAAFEAKLIPTEEDWIHHYLCILEENQKAVFETLDLLARSSAPIVFGCSAGKDRTGILTGLLLSVLGVPRQRIVDDYGLTTEALRPFFPIWSRHADQRGIAPDVFCHAILTAHPAVMDGFLTKFHERRARREPFWPPHLRRELRHRLLEV